MQELAYYTDDRVVEQYAAYAHAGLHPNERTVVDRYFRESSGAVLDLGCGTGG